MLVLHLVHLGVLLALGSVLLFNKETLAQARENRFYGLMLWSFVPWILFYLNMSLTAGMEKKSPDEWLLFDFVVRLGIPAILSSVNSAIIWLACTYILERGRGDSFNAKTTYLFAIGMAIVIPAAFVGAVSVVDTDSFYVMFSVALLSIAVLIKLFRVVVITCWRQRDSQDVNVVRWVIVMYSYVQAAHSFLVGSKDSSDQYVVYISALVLKVILIYYVFFRLRGRISIDNLVPVESEVA